MKLVLKSVLFLSLITLVSCGHFGHKKKCHKKADKKQCPISKEKCQKKKKCKKADKKQCPTKSKKCHKKKEDKTSFSPTKLETFGNLTSLVNVKWLDFTGRPDMKTAKQLKDKNYKVVINLLAPSEVKFDEKKVIEDQGIVYHNIPLLVGGEIDKNAVSKIHKVVAKHKGQKTLIHCSSGNRVAGWFGAHMYLDHKFSKEASLELAKNAGLTKAKMLKKLDTFFKTY